MTRATASRPARSRLPASVGHCGLYKHRQGALVTLLSTRHDAARLLTGRAARLQQWRQPWPAMPLQIRSHQHTCAAAGGQAATCPIWPQPSHLREQLAHPTRQQPAMLSSPLPAPCHAAWHCGASGLTQCIDSDARSKVKVLFSVGIIHADALPVREYDVRPSVGLQDVPAAGRV